ISRMEIVTGGASAVYGSDASAGVVNIILDRNVQGLRLDASYGQNKNGDFRNYSVSLASGVNNLIDGRGALTVSYEHQVTDPVASRGEVLEWCAKSAAFVQNQRGTQLYQIMLDTGIEQPCGSFSPPAAPGQGPTFQGPCNQLIAPQSRLFPDPSLPHNLFYEYMRYQHSGTTTGTLHAPGPRVSDPGVLPAPTRPDPLKGSTIPFADTFLQFNQEGTHFVPYNTSLDSFWADYAYGGTNRLVQGGDGPLVTYGRPTRNGQDRDNIFANFRFEVNDDITLNTRLTYGVTKGEQIRNAPNDLQDSVCIQLPQRPVTLGTNTATAADNFFFDKDALAVRGVNTPATGNPAIDGNQDLAGYFFQDLGALQGQPQDGNGNPLPQFFYNLGPANGFFTLLPAETQQILMDRALTYATYRGPVAQGNQIVEINGVAQDAQGRQDPNNVSSCTNNQGAFNVFVARQGVTLQKN